MFEQLIASFCPVFHFWYHIAGNTVKIKNLSKPKYKCIFKDFRCKSVKRVLSDLVNLDRIGLWRSFKATYSTKDTKNTCMALLRFFSLKQINPWYFLKYEYIDSIEIWCPHMSEMLKYVQKRNGVMIYSDR